MTDLQARLAQGLKFEKAGDLDRAYAAYKDVADAGYTAGMVAIGNLYLYKNYKGIKRLPMLWWPGKAVPDLKTAFSWFLKAAEAGDPNAMSNVGVMLHEGNGCAVDLEQSKKWLMRSAKCGSSYGIKALKDFFGIDQAGSIPDQEYDAMLEAFCKAVEAGDRATAAAQYDRLMLGKDSQLCRLGYRIAVGKYHSSDAYGQYPFPMKSNGRPCAPVIFMRVGYASAILINKDCFPEGDVVLGLSSDIRFYTDFLVFVRGVDEEGRFATYEADQFGWLSGERRAVLLRLGEAPAESIEQLQSKIQYCGVDVEGFLRETNLRDDEALLFEKGEKEYSVEIIHVTEGTAKILLRYTVDGRDQGCRVTDVSNFRFSAEE